MVTRNAALRNGYGAARLDVAQQPSSNRRNLPHCEDAPESPRISNDLRMLTKRRAISGDLLHAALQHRLANRPHLGHKVWDKDDLGPFLNLAESTG